MPHSVTARPDLLIKVYPHTYYAEQRTEVLKLLRRTNGLILNLRENIRGNVFNQPFPFITMARISPNDKLPSNLKNDGDPLSDFFVTLSSIKNSNVKGGSGNSHTSGKSGGSRPKPGFIILAFKVLDDDQTAMFDKTWHTWTGTDQLLTSLTEQYDIRKVACYKGVNIVPDVFKYIVLIEFVIDVEAGQSDLYALDCMQKFRIRRMSGYAACYTDFHSADIDRAMEDTGEMGAIIETLS